MALWNFDRITKTKPKRVEQQVGVAFVSILFGVVVGLIVSQLAGEIQAAVNDQGEYRGLRLAHLSVAVLLSVLSFIGYFASTNRPQHRIHFFNLPLGLFVLDVLMVFDYYVIFQFAESSRLDEVQTESSATPETILVLIAFVLYVFWDKLAHKIALDEKYQEAIEASVDSSDRTKSRRIVTQVFTIGVALILIVVLLWNPSTDVGVVAVDLALIGVLLAYRVAKPLFDPTVALR